MADEQYLTEKHYLVCSKGIAPKKMKVTSQNFVIFSGDKAATELDTMKVIISPALEVLLLQPELLQELLVV